MFEIRIHGRGGQGVVTAAEMLAAAGFALGKHAQAFPSFGSERMGAPVISFCRFDDKPIRSREPIMAPDAVIVQDPTLLHSSGVFEGLSSDGYVLINSTRTFAELGLEEIVRGLPAGHMRTLPASELALQHSGRAIPNAVLLGAFAALTSIVTLDACLESIEHRFGSSTGKKNRAAAIAGYEVIEAREPLEVTAC